MTTTLATILAIIGQGPTDQNATYPYQTRTYLLIWKTPFPVRPHEEAGSRAGLKEKEAIYVHARSKKEGLDLFSACGEKFNPGSAGLEVNRKRRRSISRRKTSAGPRPEICETVTE